MLAAAIDELGYEVILYSFCYSKGIKCKIIEYLLRYSKCVRYSRSYNRFRVLVSSRLYFFLPFYNYRTNISLVSCIVAESKRLDSEEQDTEEVFRAKRLALAEA